MLKNIKLKDIFCRILSVTHIPRVLIRWDINPTTQRLGTLFFNIYRSTGQSDFEQINKKPIPANTKYEYIDYTTHQRDLFRNYYYRIDAVEIINGTDKVLDSQKISPMGPSDLVATYIIEEHLFAHRHVYGVPVLIYQLMTTGARCECWDPVLKRVTTSSCQICKGSGFIGGYYDPMPSWMDFNPVAKIEQIADWGPKQLMQTDIQFTDYPILQIGDIILSATDMKFWRIENVRPTEKNRTIILQVARLNAVNRSDIEYTLDIPQEIIDNMLIEFRNRQSLREF